MKKFDPIKTEFNAPDQSPLVGNLKKNVKYLKVERLSGKFLPRLRAESDDNLHKI
jgi:hypothetical protein